MLFNQLVPKGFGYINQLLNKKALRDIIGEMVKLLGTAITTKFLDDIKNMGYNMAFKGGLSFNLGDVLIPTVKEELIKQANEEVAGIREEYNMGFITTNERYNKIIDIWGHVVTKLTEEVMNLLPKDDQGFNPVFMMLDSGARGSKEQIRQLCGMRGLMAKPQNLMLPVALRLLRTLFSPTLKRVFPCSSTSSLLTVPVRGLLIRL